MGLKRVVVLVGLPQSGKTTVATWMEELGYTRVGVREILEAGVAGLLGLDLRECQRLWDSDVAVWDHLTIRGFAEALETQLRHIHRAVLGDLVRLRVDATPNDYVVVDGVVNPVDYEALQRYYPTVVWVRRPKGGAPRPQPKHYEVEYQRMANHCLDNVADLGYLRRRFDAIASYLKPLD